MFVFRGIELVALGLVRLHQRVGACLDSLEQELSCSWVLVRARALFSAVLHAVSDLFRRPRRGRRIRHTRQSPRTLFGILDPLDHILSNKKKKFDHISTLAQTINILKQRQ